MLSRTSISFRFRSSSVWGKPGSIYLQLISNRRVKTVSTGYKIYPGEWNESLSDIRLGFSGREREEELKRISRAMTYDRECLHTRLGDQVMQGCYSLDDLCVYYRNRDHAYYFCDFVDSLNSEMPGEDHQRLREAYRSAANNLKSFNGGKAVRLDWITRSNMQRYEQYMQSKGNSANTISFYMRNTRAIYHKAIRQGLVEKPVADPFVDVFTGVAKTRKRAVRESVIEDLMRLDLEQSGLYGGKSTVHKLSFSRDMFILSFLLRGISFIDLAYLKKTDVNKGVISYVRHKTGQRLEIAVTPPISSLLRIYSYRCEDSEYLLPILPGRATRRDYLNALKRENRRLKSLSYKLGLERPLTTYVSRHSWASIALSKGFPVSVISQGLGHESEKTTRIYLDSFDYSALHDANRKITGFIKKAS